MSKIHSQNTKAEKMVFSELCKQGIYFQKHYKKAEGTPDIALPRKKKAVFIDGDFWHGYKFSRQKQRLPKKYWLAKIEGNIKRDKITSAKLKREGWRVLRIWEHEIEKNPKESVKKIIQFFK